jgi:hypothetical protein
MSYYITLNNKSSNEDLLFPIFLPTNFINENLVSLFKSYANLFLLSFLFNKSITEKEFDPSLIYTAEEEPYKHIPVINLNNLNKKELFNNAIYVPINANYCHFIKKEPLLIENILDNKFSFKECYFEKSSGSLLSLQKSNETIISEVSKTFNSLRRDFPDEMKYIISLLFLNYHFNIEIPELFVITSSKENDEELIQKEKSSFIEFAKGFLSKEKCFKIDLEKL